MCRLRHTSPASILIHMLVYSCTEMCCVLTGLGKRWGGLQWVPGSTRCSLAGIWALTLRALWLWEIS